MLVLGTVKKEMAQTPLQLGLQWDQTNNRLTWWLLWTERNVTEVWGLWTRGKPPSMEKELQGLHGRKPCFSLAGSLNSSC